MARSSLRAVASPSPPSVDVEDVPVVSMSPPKRLRPATVLAGVASVVLAALLGAYVFTASSSKVPVMVAAHDLEPGVPVSAADLRVVELRSTGALRAIQSSQQELILGEVPRAPVPAGTVLNTGLFVSASDAVPHGKAVVGAAFEAGQIPSPRLGAGDNVQLLQVAAAAPGSLDAAPRSASVLGSATVWAVTGSAEPGSSTSKVWVSLLVDESSQTAVAQAAADGVLRVSLVAGS